MVPARTFRFGVGAGISSGGVYAQEADTGDESFAQWDLHVLGRIEHRNFLGGMRRLTIEERPRLIFDQPFPSTPARRPRQLAHRRSCASRRSSKRAPRWLRWRAGTSVRIRTAAVSCATTSWPGIGPERYFFEGKLLLSSTINTDLFLPEKQDIYPNYEATYLYHVARVDLRDDPRNTHRGSYFAFGVQHGGYFLPSDWNYVRLTQDSRGYIPLPGGMVLAGRARIGFMTVTQHEHRGAQARHDESASCARCRSWRTCTLRPAAPPPARRRPQQRARLRPEHARRRRGDRAAAC